MLAKLPEAKGWYLFQAEIDGNLIAHGISNGRGGKGSIYVKAAGNSGQASFLILLVLTIARPPGVLIARTLTISLVAPLL